MLLACSPRHLGGSEPMHQARQFSQSFLGCIFKERPARMDMEKPPAWFHWSFLFLVNLAALWLLVTLWRLVEGLDVSFADIEVLEVFAKSLESWRNVALRHPPSGEQNSNQANPQIRKQTFALFPVRCTSTCACGGLTFRQVKAFFSAFYGK